MRKCLYLLCPTDCLESIINNTFKHKNYFYTSLGNSFAPDIETIGYIKQMVKRHHIREIYFVLSNDNQIILDALGEQFFSGIRGLKKLYNEIIKEKESSEVSWQTGNHRFPILSYYLNKKIKELQLELGDLPNHPIKIKGKIYNRQNEVFDDIYSDLICIENHYLN